MIADWYHLYDAFSTSILVANYIESLDGAYCQVVGDMFRKVFNHLGKIQSFYNAVSDVVNLYPRLLLQASGSSRKSLSAGAPSE